MHRGAFQSGFGLLTVMLTAAIMIVPYQGVSGLIAWLLALIWFAAAARSGEQR